MTVLSVAGLASFALCYAGLGGLCLAMDRHHRQVWRRHVPAKMSRWFRVGGWALLGLSLFECARAAGIGGGMVLWLGLLSAATTLIAISLAYAPKVFASCVMAAAPIGMLLMLR